MVRLVSALALALAIAFSGSILSGAVSDAAAKSKLGVCKKTSLIGTTKTWTCKSSDYCCSVPILGYYGCGAKKLFGCVKI
jgi:hypothetical protein